MTICHNLLDEGKTFEWSNLHQIPFLTDSRPLPFSWSRAELTPEEWARIYPLLPGGEGQRGRPRTPESDFRILNGICWIKRTGAPWKDLPEIFGSHKSAWSRFSRWTKAGVWDRVYETIQEQEAEKIDWSLHHVDSVTCCAHPDAAGARHPASLSTEEARTQEMIGKSRGGWCTKIHVRCEGNGKPMVLLIGEGNRHDSIRFIDVMEHGEIKMASGQSRKRPKAVAADKAYGGKKNRDHLRSKGIKATIPYKTNKINPRPQDRALYKKRNIVERLFRWMQKYRRLATRFDKRGANFRAFWVIGAIRMWLRDPFSGAKPSP